MNAVLGRITSTAQELAHYHSGEGNNPFSFLRASKTKTAHLLKNTRIEKVLVTAWVRPHQEGGTAGWCQSAGRTDARTR